MDKKANLYLSDFFTGLLAALALQNVSVLSLRGNRFDLAMEKLTDDLAKEASKQNLTVRFRIKTHPIHRDSTIVQQALYEAAQRDLVSLDNPEYQDVRLKISGDEAPSYLTSVSGTPEMYERLARRLVDYYYEVSECL